MANRDREKVMVAYPVDKIEPEFHRSMLALFAYDANTKRHVVTGGNHLMMQTTNLPHGRNLIVRDFLKTQCEWLWFVDTDQVFEPDVLERMLASADPVERPILGALIFGYNVENPELPYAPTIYMVGEDGPTRLDTFPRDTVLRCYATGTGCVLIHRSVLEAVGQKFAKTSFPWFRYTEFVNAEGEPDQLSEDITFMARAGSCGFPVHVDTSIEVGHVKAHTVTAEFHYRNMPFEMLVPNTYVVIPVRDRLDLTKQILHQLEDQGGYEEILVYDNGSGGATKQWLKHQTIATVIDAPDMNIHEMWNAGITHALSAWPKANVAILNNDLKLGPDFLTNLADGLRSGDPKLVAVSARYDDRDMGTPVEQTQGICAGRYDGTGGFAGFAFMLAADKTGPTPFDPQFEFYFGDNSFLIDIERAGGWYAIVRDATCEHIGGGSQTDELFFDETFPKKLADEERFKAKYAVHA